MNPVGGPAGARSPTSLIPGLPGGTDGRPEALPARAGWGRLGSAIIGYQQLARLAVAIERDLAVMTEEVATLVNA